MSPWITVHTYTRSLCRSGSHYWHPPGLCVSQSHSTYFYLGSVSSRVTVLTATLPLCHSGSQYLYLPDLCVSQVTERRTARPLCHPWSQYWHLSRLSVTQGHSIDNGLCVSQGHSAYIHQASVLPSVIVLTSNRFQCHPGSQYWHLPDLGVTQGHTTYIYQASVSLRVIVRIIY